MKKIFKAIQVAFRNPSAFMGGVGRVVKELDENPLSVAAGRHGSDKGISGHLYTKPMHRILSGKHVKNILEIGLLNHSIQRNIGGDRFDRVPSLDMWAQVFPSADIYGFDIKNFEDAVGSWSRILQGDQSSRDDLRQVTELCEGFDLIVDDALHASPHQQISFSFLFAFLKPGGYYVIEDLNFQPGDFERDDVPKTAGLLRALQVNGVWDSPLATESEKEQIEKDTDCIRFFSSFGAGDTDDALAVIRKRS